MANRDLGSFRELCGDELFYRKVGNRRYHVLSFQHWADLDSSAVADYGNYLCELSEVDLTIMPEGQIKGALKCCGYELHAHGVYDPHSGLTIAASGSLYFDLCLVECCYQYGAKAPLSSDSGNNKRNLVRATVRLSRSLERDAEAYEEHMDRPVNAIGTSARDYMTGNYGLRSL